MSAQIESQTTEAPKVPVFAGGWIAGIMNQQLMLSIMVSLVVTHTGLLAYHWLIPSKNRIAVVDLAKVIETKELLLSEIMLKPGASEQDRRYAMVSAASLGGEIEKAMSELSADCKCVILTRAAVVNSATEDLSGALRQKLGIDKIDSVALGARVTELLKAPAKVEPDNVRSAPVSK